MVENQTEQAAKTDKLQIKKGWVFIKAFSKIVPALGEGIKCTLSEDAINFEFKLTRFKDNISHEESLKIENFYKEKSNGAIITSIYNLERDIKKLMQYGVVFNDFEYYELREEIRRAYLKLDPQEPGELSFGDNPNRMQSLLYGLGTLFTQTEGRDNLYCIPVSEFNSLALECEYNTIEFRSLRTKLIDNGYIMVSDKTTPLTKINGKPVRVLYFYKGKMKDYMPDTDQSEDAPAGNEG